MFVVDTETGSHPALTIDQQIHLALADPAVRVLDLGEEVLPPEQDARSGVGLLQSVVGHCRATQCLPPRV
jgi:hypothetical protein